MKPWVIEYKEKSRVKQMMVRKAEYYDSIQLMRVSEDIRAVPGVTQALVGMATESNKQVLKDLGLLSEEGGKATSADMLVGVESDAEEIITMAFARVDELLKAKVQARGKHTVHQTLDSALKAMPDANLCVISVPGEHAFTVAQDALLKGMHVLVYSDNVPLEQERRLKELATQQGLLCMGPDCGVSNINGVAFMTASVAKRGPIGIVGASGSGTQQIAVICDKEGSGISQAIGVGGKDLKDEVGGLEMLFGIDLLEADRDTAVVILVSRAPGERTLPVILERVKNCRKPVVAYFIGGDPSIIAASGAVAAVDLEDAALKAVDIACNRKPRTGRFSLRDAEIEKLVSSEVSRLAPGQRYLRGLFCGGTFCEEAMSLLKESIGDTWSNAPLRGDLKLPDSMCSRNHTVIDLGDEEFTLGRPHPVIDPEPVRRAVLREANDMEVAVYLMDFILGPAIHPDPVGAVIAEIREAKNRFAQKNKYLSVVASVCGTDSDPQNLTRQEAKLREAGVVVMPTNAQASRLAGMIAAMAGTR
jgi:FdrA protein